MKCPTCGHTFDPKTSPATPFCCERCRSIDLRRWMAEDYSVTVERDRELDQFRDEKGGGATSDDE